MSMDECLPSITRWDSQEENKTHKSLKIRRAKESEEKVASVFFGG